MYVPTLAGTRSGEAGHANYQHPRRVREGVYNVHVDRFSHLVIFSAVHCLLAGERDLWKRFNNGENLLFREQDFHAPGQSGLFRTLWETNAPSIHALVGRLALACRQPLEETPWLDEVIVNGQVRALTRKEESNVTEMLAVRQTAATVPVTIGRAAPIAQSQPLSLETPETATTNTRPISAAGTVPLGSRVSVVKTSVLRGLAAAARPLDALLRRLVGEKNDLLRRFLWAVFPMLLFAMLWPAARILWHPSSAPSIAQKSPALPTTGSKFKPTPRQVLDRPRNGLQGAYWDSLSPRELVDGEKRDSPGKCVIVGKVVLDPGDDPSAISFQTPVLKSGVFASAIGDLTRPIGFRMHHYAPYDLDLNGKTGDVVDVGEIRMRRLAPSELVPLKGKLVLEGGTDPSQAWVSFQVCNGPVNTPSNGTRPAAERWWSGTVAVDSSGSLDAEGFSPIEYYCSIGAIGYVSKGFPITFKPNVGAGLGTITLEKPRRLIVEYIVSKAGRFDMKDAKKVALAGGDSWKATPAAYGDDLQFKQEGGNLSFNYYYGPCFLADLGPTDLQTHLNVDVARATSDPRGIAVEDGHVYLLKQLDWRRNVLFKISMERANTRPAAPAPKEITVDLGGGLKLEVVLIPAGEFLMGSPDPDKDAQTQEKPQHRVRITKPFYLGKYPVTQEQWEAVMGGNPSHFKGPMSPVEMVSWDDCQKFLNKLSAKSGNHRRKFRLPTEAQWEYACRAGSATCYYFGDGESALGEYAWHNANSDSRTHPVGEKKPNAWGLYDMHGNVWQWCEDWFDDNFYKGTPVDDPAGPSAGSDRVSRGGSWSYTAKFCRSASRNGNGLDNCNNNLGFRVSLVLADKPSEQATSANATLRPTVESASSTAARAHAANGF